MRAEPRETHFPVSLYGTPNAVYQDVFYSVLRAGHVQSAPGYAVKRDHFPGHELILALSGRAIANAGGVVQEVVRGDLVWFNCQHPHEHSSDVADPWEALWVRVDGPQLDRIGSMLAIETAPVIRGIDNAAAERSLRAIFAEMQRGGADSAPLIHAHVANLIALACCVRKLPADVPRAPSAIQRVVERMRREYFTNFTVADLAAEAGMSVSHFGRMFRRTFSTGPIDWLRRERITHAKRRLRETNDPVHWVAEQVGYRDRFFFSKDFKKMTGLTPREFRRREFGADFGRRQ